MSLDLYTSYHWYVRLRFEQCRQHRGMSRAYVQEPSLREENHLRRLRLVDRLYIKTQMTCATYNAVGLNSSIHVAIASKSAGDIVPPSANNLIDLTVHL